MKKKNIINLIKYYSEKNDAGFRSEAYEIAKDFDSMGDHQLSAYIMALLSDVNTFIPQTLNGSSSFFRKLEINNDPLPLPDCIKEDIIGIVNAASQKIGVNKFLFQGSPGTGKTETVKQIARILDRELFMVDFDMLIDSKLGQTSKNISALFTDIDNFAHPEKVIVLLDEIDMIALDRTNQNDLREMGRATSAILKGLDYLNDSVVLIATTNLFASFDKALVRRFDSIINFNRYCKEDLIEIAVIILNSYLSKFASAGRNVRLFRKILEQLEEIPYPGDLKNLIKTSLAFSNPENEFDYLKRFYCSLHPNDPVDVKTLRHKGYTVREIEILTNISKSQVSRELKE